MKLKPKSIHRRYRRLLMSRTADETESPLPACQLRKACAVLTPTPPALTDRGNAWWAVVAAAQITVLSLRTTSEPRGFRFAPAEDGMRLDEILVIRRRGIFLARMMPLPRGSGPSEDMHNKRITRGYMMIDILTGDG